MASPGPMFIRVKYGNNDTLICNPGCATVNLLTSIKNRTGHGANAFTIDLTDDSGLVLELDLHRHDRAADHLSAPGATYVLVKKQRQQTTRHGKGDALSTATGDYQVTVDEEENVDDDELGELKGDRVKSHYDYVPLLNNWHELLPGYSVHRRAAAGTLGASELSQSSLGMTAAARRKLMRRDRNTSPAGVKPTVGGKTATNSGTSKTMGKERPAVNKKQDKPNGVQTA